MDCYLIRKEIIEIDKKIVKYYRHYDIEYDPIESYYLDNNVIEFEYPKQEINIIIRT